MPIDATQSTSVNATGTDNFFGNNSTDDVNDEEPKDDDDENRNPDDHVSFPESTMLVDMLKAGEDDTEEVKEQEFEF